MVFLVDRGRDYQVKSEHHWALVMEARDPSMEVLDQSMEVLDLSMEVRDLSMEALDLFTEPRVQYMEVLARCMEGQFMVQVCDVSYFVELTV